MTIKPLEEFLKGKSENNKVNTWSIELSSYKLNIQYIKGAENVLANCLSLLVDAHLNDCDYEPKNKNLDVHYFEDLWPDSNNQDHIEMDDIHDLNVLDTETHNVKA